ncbi:type II toxin-antitoxin system VapC family toxin [Candidatus Pacearchaeota archaeon]|nr:type II toxin-antitoxin system VapC family toxin [Candidatus Pacearchaeota archaeon]
MYLIFDTSILIELERGNREIIAKINEIRKIYPTPAKISFISYFEFLYGLKEKSEKNKERALAFIEKFSILQTTKITAHNLVSLKAKYEFPLADLLIAAQTMEESAILLTKDKDFEDIKEIEKIILR